MLTLLPSTSLNELGSNVTKTSFPKANRCKLSSLTTPAVNFPLNVICVALIVRLSDDVSVGAMTLPLLPMVNASSARVCGFKNSDPSMFTFALGCTSNVPSTSVFFFIVKSISFVKTRAAFVLNTILEFVFDVTVMRLLPTTCIMLSSSPSNATPAMFVSITKWSPASCHQDLGQLGRGMLNPGSATYAKTMLLHSRDTILQLQLLVRCH